MGKGTCSGAEQGPAALSAALAPLRVQSFCLCVLQGWGFFFPPIFFLYVFGCVL